MEHSSSLSTRRLVRRRGDYGFDAPYVPLLLGLVGAIFLTLGLLSLWVLRISVLGVICMVYAVFFLLSVVSYVYTTRWGKFRAWANILTQLRLRGDEQLLDLGCGRGAVLLMAAASPAWRSTISRMRQDVSRRSTRPCASSNQVGGS